LLFTLTGCAKEDTEDSFVYTLPEESEESEESQTVTFKKEKTLISLDWNIDLTKMPSGWTKPHIWRITIDPTVWQSDSLWDGAELSEKANGYLTSIFEKAENEKIWGNGIVDPEYSIQNLINTESDEYSADSTPVVLTAADTWTMQVQAAARVVGSITVRGGLVYEADEHDNIWIENWNFQGQDKWVLKQEGPFLYAMTYAEYAYARLLLDNEEDPFTHEWLEEEEEKTVEIPDDAYYFEPMQDYLYADVIIYTYEGTEETTDRGAAYVLATKFMDHLCATPYEEGMDDTYKIREYRDVTFFKMRNRLAPEEGEILDITDESFLTYDWMYDSEFRGVYAYGVTGLPNLANMWLLHFQFEVQGDGNCQIYAASEWDDEYVTDIRVTYDNAGVMVKEGNTYYMVMAKDIVSR
jgi:hypothetical protein